MRHPIVKFGSISALLVLTALSSELARAASPLPLVEGSWTLAILPDTAAYVKDYPEVFRSQTRWIALHKEDHQIAFVLHVGSITQNNNPSQWKNASSAFEILDEAGVSYAMTLGKMDYSISQDNSFRETLAGEYLAWWRFDSQPNFEGSWGSGLMESSFHLFKACGEEYVVVVLGFDPSDLILGWADEVLSMFADHTAILLTHAYLCPPKLGIKGEAGTMSEFVDGPAQNSIDSDILARIWDQLVEAHENVLFLFCGGCNGSSERTKNAVNGKLIHEMAVNMHGFPDGGGGYLRLMEFLPDGHTVQVKTYSPYLNHYLTDEEHQFTLRLSPHPNSLMGNRERLKSQQSELPPIADAGPDRTVRQGAWVTLDGSNSRDPDGVIASYLWEQTNGISVVLSDPTAVGTSFRAPNVEFGKEVLTFRLSVTDNDGLQDADGVTVDVIDVKEDDDYNVIVFANCFVSTIAP